MTVPPNPCLMHISFLKPTKLPPLPLKFRPIISQCSAFITPLAKYVANILTPLVGSFSDAHLTGSQDFTARLKNFYDNTPHLLSAPLLSLDVEALFTNVPLKSVLSFLSRKFTENNLPLPEGLTIDALIQLIKLCCDSTVFSFNNCFYQQIGDVAMGSHLPAFWQIFSWNILRQN